MMTNNTKKIRLLLNNGWMNCTTYKILSLILLHLQVLLLVFPATTTTTTTITLFTIEPVSAYLFQTSSFFPYYNAGRIRNLPCNLGRISSSSSSFSREIIRKSHILRLHRVDSFSNDDHSVNRLRQENNDTKSSPLENKNRIEASIICTKEQQQLGEISTTKTTIKCNIRDSTYNELNQSVDLIMLSFYSSETTKGMWKQFYRMGELNRLQQGYPYGDDKELHRMMVATIVDDTNDNKDDVEDEKIIGFVDIDIRPATNLSYKYNPRPYLSDLCIHPDYRRKGIAKQLIQSCEKFCLQLSNDTIERANKKQQRSTTTIINRDELYIRVESKNKNAIQMYNNLGYKQIVNPEDPNGKEIIILYKKLK